MHIVRNGDVGSITNYSKQYIFSVVDVSIPHDANLAHVYNAIEDVGKQLKAGNPDILEPTQMDGVESISATNLLLRTSTKVKPGKHLYIQRVLRRMFTEALLREGITLSAQPENPD